MYFIGFFQFSNIFKNIINKILGNIPLLKISFSKDALHSLSSLERKSDQNIGDDVKTQSMACRFFRRSLPNFKTLVTSNPDLCIHLYIQ
jgi:hypothetical protein